MLMDVCNEDKSLEDARSIHEHLLRSRPHLDIKMYNKILEMYGKCGSMNDAFLVFRKMPQRNLTSWDTMITWLGYLDEAMEFIERMPIQPSIEVWDTMMNLCTIHGNSELAEIVELLDPSRLDEQSKAGFLAVKASE
ncbi:hypothetical protein RDI58_017882 [Solanum bulbocastanum]|uniref:Pentatricopeptide repeat-containing protein n=1 Tax=Solanum bulbocastanum TaxID=147425 RepID=A0AAN8TFV1_SOLBU